MQVVLLAAVHFFFQGALSLSPIRGFLCSQV
jgi:hypothetical protein